MTVMNFWVSKQKGTSEILSAHGGDYNDQRLKACDPVQFGTYMPKYWRHISEDRKI
jgi:hypothetical protein